MISKNSKFLPWIAGVIAVLTFAASIPFCRYSLAEWHNKKAVRIYNRAPEEAMVHLEKAVRLNRRNPVYHLNLGLSYMNKVSDMALDSFLMQEKIDLPDSAVSCFENSVGNSFNESIPILNLAFAYAVSSDEYKALALLEPLIEQEHCWLPVLICYGMILERLGNEEDTEEFIFTVIGNNPIVLESRYFAELKTRNPAIADAALGRAIANAKAEYENNGNPQSTAKFGELEYLGGNIAFAETLLRESVAELPSMNRPWLFLGRIEEGKGNMKSALTCYGNAVQLDRYDALPVFFRARAKGRDYVGAEQMRELLSLEQRMDFRLRYMSVPASSILWVNGFEEYCTYDFQGEIEQDRYERNIAVMNRAFASRDSLNITSLQDLTALMAQELSGTPCEAGLLDVYPETLRIILDRTDKLQFIESCVALALTAGNMSITDGGNGSACRYDLLSDNIRCLRYRDGVVSRFSDRLFYFSEWAGQANENGLLEEYTSQFGHEYRQSFSYLSDHLSFLPNVSNDPGCKDDVLKAERCLEDNNPYYIIPAEEMNEAIYNYLQNGDIVAVVSDRKGEDVSRVGIVCRQDPSPQLVYASNKAKKVIAEDLRQVCQSCSGIRTFRIKTPDSK